MSTVRAEVVAVLRSFGVTEQVAHRTAAFTSKERLCDAIEYMNKKTNVNDRASYLLAALNGMRKGTWNVPLLDSFLGGCVWDEARKEAREQGFIQPTREPGQEG